MGKRLAIFEPFQGNMGFTLEGVTVFDIERRETSHDNRTEKGSSESPELSKNFASQVLAHHITPASPVQESEEGSAQYIARCRRANG